MLIGNNYNLHNRPSFGTFRMTGPAKKKIEKLDSFVHPSGMLRLFIDVDKAKEMFSKFKKDDLAIYIKDGKLSASYFMRDGCLKPYATATLEVEDAEHVHRFARRIRQYTEYGEFFDDYDTFMKKPKCEREFV